MTDFQRKFGLAKNEDPNYGRQAVEVHFFRNQKLARSQPLDWYGFGL